MKNFIEGYFLMWGIIANIAIIFEIYRRWKWQKILMELYGKAMELYGKDGE